MSGFICTFCKKRVMCVVTVDRDRYCEDCMKTKYKVKSKGIVFKLEKSVLDK